MALLLEGLFWEAACVGLWLLTLSSVSPAEVVVAAVAGLPCAALAVAARRAVGGSWRPRPAWAAWLLPLPVAVVADTVRVLRLAAGVLRGRRIPDGELREVELPRDRPAALRRTREAAAVALVSATPGTLVLDVGAGRMLVHALGALALWARRPKRSTAWAPVVTGLRRVHSGHVGDYVAWLFVGVAGLAALVGLPLV